ncbi:phage holin family protein [Advenella sp. FME57]|uniref:phage holin family protein n=1 Tax=Advenella sp. FME57 TaxID=2742604 RepID=UPI0018672DEB|nr:phage holin family protein [Advenella sp. FME57]
MSVKQNLRAVSGGFTSLVKTRLELLSLELTEEKDRLLSVLLFGAVGLLFLHLALTVVAVLVGLLFWGTEYRYIALAVLVLVYALIGLGCLLLMKKHLGLAATPFAATIDALRDDAQALRGRSEPASAAATKGVGDE